MFIEIHEWNGNQFWFLAAELLPGGPDPSLFIYEWRSVQEAMAPPTHARHTQVYICPSRRSYMTLCRAKERNITIRRRQKEAVYSVRRWGDPLTQPIGGKVEKKSHGAMLHLMHRLPYYYTIIYFIHANSEKEKGINGMDESKECCRLFFHRL